MRATLTILVLAIAALCLASRPLAQGKHITNIADKHALIEKRRPQAKLVSGAERAVAKLESRQIPVINAMRMIARSDVRLAEDPYVHGRMDIPALGSLEGHKDHQPDPWVLLRIAALLRNGYPGEPNMMKEIAAWLDSAAPARNSEWADASLELLALDSLARRGDPMLAPLQERAAARARNVVSRRDWTRQALAKPGLYELSEHLNFMLARGMALRNGWGEGLGADSLAPVFDEICNCMKACRDPETDLWFTVPKDQDSVYYRAVLVLSSLLSLVETDPALPRKLTDEAGKYARIAAARLPADPAHADAWRAYDGDALLLTLAARDKLSREVLRVIDKEPAVRALNPGRFSFGQPMPKNGHIAPQLRWVLCRSLGDQGMGRAALDVEDRDRLSCLCLSLLAASGGLLSETQAEPMGWGDAETAFRALDTLDLDDYFGYMVKTDLAIDASAKWMLGKQGSDGLFFGANKNVLGGHALAVHALLDAGVSRDDARVKKAFELMVGMVRERVKEHTFGAHSNQNYSCSIALMTFQSWYEPEIHACGMYEARTFEQYHAARGKLWGKIKAEHRDLIAEISWRLSNADGFGWGYSLPDEKRPRPSPITVQPEGGKGEGDSPTTGGKAEEKAGKQASALEDERARRGREGRHPPRPDKPALGERHGDNSNSQYSVLGLKAGMTLGAPIDFGTLAWEAQRLIEGFVVHGWDERLIDPTILLTLEQMETRRESRYADDDTDRLRLRPTLQAYQIGGWSYFCNGANTWGATDNEPTGGEDGQETRRWPISVAMTAAGISSLTIIRDALMVAPVYDPVLISKVDYRIAGGLYGLGQMYPYSRDYFKLDAKQSECWIGGGEGFGMLYDMYSCERAGVLTGKVWFGTAEWYRDGADVILKEQQKDGGWTALENALCNASWTILFLKRSAPYLATQRPPRDTSPVTGK